MKILGTVLLSIAVASLLACQSAPSEQLAKAEQITSTAQSNVRVLPHKFVIPHLQRERVIRVYLPPGYSGSDKRYPVLYMHDGQNLFDINTAYAGEWEVDESLNAMAERGIELIVVGIDNGAESRMQEYSPWDHGEFGPGQGEEYMAFVVEVLKPYIDRHFRTLHKREYTGIMGSSMGGLISHYALLSYPQVFSKAGIFSPSYWYAEDVFTETSSDTIDKNTRLFFTVGGQEGEMMVKGMQRMSELLVEAGHPADNLASSVIPERGHNEAFWAEQFPNAIVWLFGQE